MLSKKIAAAFKFAVDSGSTHHRDIQQEYSQHVGKVIDCAYENEHGQAFIEAGTGVGKTLGYLIPALINSADRNERTVISTHTIALQKQIMQEDGDMTKALDAVEFVTGKRPTVAVRLGLTNFIDPLRLFNLIEKGVENDIKQDVLDSWKALEAWALTSNTGLFSEYFETTDEQQLPEGLTQNDICLTNRSKLASREKYNEHVQKAILADVLIVNHMTLLVDAMFSGRLIRKGNDKKIGVVIIDECDQLPIVAEGLTSTTLPLQSLVDDIKAIQDVTKWESCNELLSDAQALLAKVNELLPENNTKNTETIKPLDEIPQQIVSSLSIKFGIVLSKLTAVIKQANGDKIDDILIESLYQHKVDLEAIIDLVNSNTNDTVALRWSPRKANPSIRTFMASSTRVLKTLWSFTQSDKQMELIKKLAEKTNKTVDEVLNELRAQTARTLILTSATVSAPTVSGKPDYTELKVEYGIYDQENPCSHLHNNFEPKEFGSASFVYPDPSAPAIFIKTEKNEEDDEDYDDNEREINPEWVQYCIRMIAAAKLHGGRTLVLTNSYRASELLCESLRVIGIEPIEKTRQNKISECVDKIVKHGDSVFVSPSAWEGLDLSAQDVKNGFQHVIITQLPFKYVDGVKEKTLRKKLISKGVSKKVADNILYASSRMSALRKFKQGFGRGIRSFSDSVCLWVADPRFPLPERLKDSPDAPLRTNKCLTEFMNSIPVRFRSDRVINGNLIKTTEISGSIFLKENKILTYLEMDI